MTKYLKQKNHFNTLQKAHKAFLSNADKSGYLSTKDTDGLLVEKEKNFLLRILNDQYLLEESIDAVERLSYVYLLHTDYCLHVTKDKTKALESLKKSYGYHILTAYIMLSCDKVFTRQKNFVQENMAFGLSLHFLFSGTLEKSLLSFLFKKLESPSQLQTPLMFVLKLFETETEFNDTLAYPYNIVLEKKDDDKIDYFVSLLCETHIELSREDEFFSHPLVKLFPYEVLVWLKLRELKGLKNPKSFTHPLMKTPIVKMFLDIKEPLPKPTELPYAKELLEKLQKRCPDMQIPAWLEAVDMQKEEESQTITSQAIEQKETETNSHIIRSNQIVKKSGIYQAFLPSTHPLAQKVHQMPQSQRLGVEGVSMLPLGLSPEDEEQLRWEWIRE